MSLKADKLLFDTKAKITNKYSKYITNRVYFEASSSRQLSLLELAQIQFKLGYHTLQHGMFNYRINYVNNKYVYNWFCFNKVINIGIGA